MNSLEFIKQHVKEWPSDSYGGVILFNDGIVNFYVKTVGYRDLQVDLSEHFAPDYYDGKVWTREEFEAFGVVEYRYNSSLPYTLLKSECGEYYCLTDSGTWCKYEVMVTSQWENAERITLSEAEDIIKSNDTRPDSPSTGIDATVEERGNRYGAFKDGADIMQDLKSVMRSTRNWSNLTPSQREALEMIQHKVGRILNGDPDYTDSWHDIKGYAHLIEEELNGNAK